MTGPMLIMTAPTTAADKVALGVLNSHLLEDTEVIIGVVGLLAAVALRHDLAGLNVIEQAFVGARDWTLLNGPHSSRSHAGRARWTRLATFHSSASGRPGAPSTDRSTTMSTTKSSPSSRGPRVRSALGLVAIIAFLVAGLAACSSSGDSPDEWPPEPASEVEPDENENEPGENERPENERDENERDENERDENENERGEADENDNEADENEPDEREEGDGEDD